MSDIRLLVNGREYGGWTSARVTRGIEAVAGSFALDVSERWDGQAEPWPIQEEDECEVRLEGTTLLKGYVDTRSHAFDATSHSLSVEGRDKTGALVDCSALLSQWEFSKIGVLELCQTVAAPFDITVSLQDGLSDTAITTSGASTSRRLTSGTPGSVGSKGKSSSMKLGQPVVKLTINPGDSPFEVIDRACRMVGVLPVSDGNGGLLLTRAGGSRATTALIEGGNILTASATFDATRRYRRYIVSGQAAGTDDLFGAPAAAVKAEATDENVRRTERVLLIRPEGSVTLEFAKQRAAWEATVRRARAASFDITVQGWRQASGALWPINALVQVKSTKLAIDLEEMLITQTTFGLSKAGSTTTLKVVLPNSFIPEPVIVKSGGAGGADSRLS